MPKPRSKAFAVLNRRRYELIVKKYTEESGGLTEQEAEELERLQRIVIESVRRYVPMKLDPRVEEMAAMVEGWRKTAESVLDDLKNNR